MLTFYEFINDNYKNNSFPLSFTIKPKSMQFDFIKNCIN